jgi:GNAT superfamily N-acetyltransferase
MTIAAPPTEVLENGYHPHTPAGDNLLLDYARGEAAAFAATVGAGGGRLARDEDLGVQLCDLGVPSPFGNVALLERPSTDRSTPELAAVLDAFFGPSAGGPYLVFSAWPLDLAGHGFAPVGHPPLMLRPPGGAAPIVDGLRIEAVTDADQLAAFEQTLVEAYPAPEMQPWVRGAMFDPAMLATDWRLFVGYEGDTPVATAGAFVTPSVTVVELVSTRPEARGKGYGTAITAAATLVEPANPSMLIASDLGRSTYDRLGYVPLLRYSLWLGTRRAPSHDG